MTRQISLHDLLVYEAVEESRKIQYEEIRRRLRIYKTKRTGAPVVYARDVQFLFDELRRIEGERDRRNKR